MLSCKELVKIMNSKEEMSFFQRAEMRMHLMMCKHCAAYSKHLQIMRKGFKVLFSKISKTEPETIKRIEDQTIEKIKKSSGQ